MSTFCFLASSRSRSIQHVRLGFIFPFLLKITLRTHIRKNVCLSQRKFPLRRGTKKPLFGFLNEDNISWRPYLLASQYYDSHTEFFALPATTDSTERSGWFRFLFGGGMKAPQKYRYIINVRGITTSSAVNRESWCAVLSAFDECALYRWWWCCSECSVWRWWTGVSIARLSVRSAASAWAFLGVSAHPETRRTRPWPGTGIRSRNETKRLGFRIGSTKQCKQ